VLLGYILTLAPTVTLWDAGEFITAARVLGIPHPPGTPLFVMLGHTWGNLVPLGGYAWRLNLLSAVCSALGAGFVFLVAHRVLHGEPALLRRLGAAAAATASAFCFTAWQNSNETEVYATATALIAATMWLALRWRDTRSPRYLLLVVYLAALSIGNHLLALLAGPAVIVFVALTLWKQGASEARARQAEWSQWAVLTALWLLLLAVGLGRERLFWIAAAAVLAAAVWAALRGTVAFPVLAVVAAAIGVSTYAFLYIRAGLHPLLNEADPSTWHNLLAVIRREQYPPRSPLDNPMFQSGPGNPGRTLVLFGQQLVNYFQYFDWQWSRSIGLTTPVGLTGRLVLTLLFLLLGVVGWGELRRRDAGAFGLLGTLWLVTGLGLVVYMNFKPGFSLFWNHYGSIDQHEVRERDYFFIASFQAWGAIAGIGLTILASRLAAATRGRAVALLAVALVPAILNWKAATRRGPDAQLGRDFAYDLLQSVGPWGILFTYGDNDTFPVWYLQEVEGVRQDVDLVNLSLANTDWYVDQMRRRLPRPFDRAAAPPVWQRTVGDGVAPPGPLLVMPDSVYVHLRAFQQQADDEFTIHDVPITMRRGQTILPRDVALLYMLDTHLGKRPMAFGAAAGQGEWLGLDRSVVQRGLGYWITARPDSLPGVIRGVNGGIVDTAVTRELADHVYRYAGLLDADTRELDPAARQLASALSRPWLELAQAGILRRDQQTTVNYLRRALRLMPNRQLDELLARIESEGLEALLRQQETPPPP
jgi:hypothetical protein